MRDRPVGLAGSQAVRSLVALALVGAGACADPSSNPGSGFAGATGGGEPRGGATGGGGLAAGDAGRAGSEPVAAGAGGRVGSEAVAAGAAGAAGSAGANGGVPVAGESSLGAEGGAYPLPEDADQTGFFTWTYHGQPVGFYLPEPTGEPLPVVMFLHGCGNDPVTPSWWIIDALNQVEPCAVLLPFRPRDESPTCSAWGGTYDDELRPAMVDALAGLDSVILGYGLDSDRQYLYGESMGGEGVLKLLVELPTRFAGAIVADGYVEDATGAELMAESPLWLLHGTADSISPVASIEALHQAIQGAGKDLVKLTLYEGLEHSPAIVRARSEPGLLEWLLAQRHDGTLREPVVVPEEDPPDDGTSGLANVTFEVTGIDATYDGMTLAVALLPGETDCTTWADGEILGSGEGTVAGGGCEVVMSTVPADFYTACAFVDADGNLQPSPGDLIGQTFLSAAGDQDEPWSASDWIQI